jgi:hypothetical protein
MANQFHEDVLRKQRLIDVLVKEKDSILQSIHSLDHYFVRTTERERILSDRRLLKATADAFGIENPCAEGVPTNLPDSIYKLVVEIVNLLNFRSNLLTETTIKERCDAVNREKSSAVALAVSVAEKQVARDVARTWQDRNERESAELRLKHSRELEELAARLSDEHEKECYATQQEHERELVQVACDSKLKAVAQLADSQRKALDENSASWQQRMDDMRDELLREKERAISAAVRAVEAGNRSQQSRLDGRSAHRDDSPVVIDDAAELDMDDAMGRSSPKSQGHRQTEQHSPLPTPPRVNANEGSKSPNRRDGVYSEYEDDNGDGSRLVEVKEGETELDEEVMVPVDEVRPSPIENLLRVTMHKVQMQHILASDTFVGSTTGPSPTDVAQVDVEETSTGAEATASVPELVGDGSSPTAVSSAVKLELRGSPQQQAAQWLCTTFASPAQINQLQQSIASANETKASRDNEAKLFAAAAAAALAEPAVTNDRPDQKQGGPSGIMKKMVKAKTMSLQLTRAARVPRGFPHPRFRGKLHAARSTTSKSGKPDAPLVATNNKPSTTIIMGDGASGDNARASMDVAMDATEHKETNNDVSVLEGTVGTVDATAAAEEEEEEEAEGRDEYRDENEPQNQPHMLSAAPGVQPVEPSAAAAPKPGMRQRFGALIKNHSRKFTVVSARRNRAESSVDLPASTTGDDGTNIGAAVGGERYRTSSIVSA